MPCCRSLGDDGLPVHPIKADYLKPVVDRYNSQGRPFNMGMVFPVSTHNYELRYWLAAGGIHPGYYSSTDISGQIGADAFLSVTPPPQMPATLEAGTIYGYCVGEPWNTYAVSEGLGHTLVTSYDIWNNHPEKVFAVTRIWAQSNPNAHKAVLMALLEACVWLDEAANRPEACELLSNGRYVNVPVDVLEKSLTGTLLVSSEVSPRSAPDYNVFHRYAANFPWRSHAVWFLSQMLRWGELDDVASIEKTARAVYRPEVFRAAAEALGLPAPHLEEKTEGEHIGSWTLESGHASLPMGADRFMDKRTFDAKAVPAYVAGFAIKRWPMVTPMEASTDKGNSIIEHAL